MADSISFQGSSMLFISPRSGADEWTIVDYTLPAQRFGAPLHYHEDLVESFYVLSGELWMQVGDEERTLGPGALALVNPGTLHAFANKSDAPVRFLAHASNPDHKKFLCRLVDLAKEQAAWPPKDPAPFIELGRQYDTIYATA